MAEKRKKTKTEERRALARVHGGDLVELPVAGGGAAILELTWWPWIRCSVAILKKSNFTFTGFVNGVPVFLAAAEIRNHFSTRFHLYVWERTVPVEEPQLRCVATDVELCDLTGRAVSSLRKDLADGTLRVVEVDGRPCWVIGTPPIERLTDDGEAYLVHFGRALVIPQDVPTDLAALLPGDMEKA